ncbi:hypothetical protein HPB49_025665 [Dermacentor silvarum]|nr:hypothetical protein HPB49_025665 [Dermacentor silvarum]
MGDCNKAQFARWKSIDVASNDGSPEDGFRCAVPANGQHVDEAVATEQQEQVQGSVAMPNREEESPPDPGAASTPPEHEDMDTHTGLANLHAGKRPRDQTNSLATTQDSSGGDEPPPKAPGSASGPPTQKPTASKTTSGIRPSRSAEDVDHNRNPDTGDIRVVREELDRLQGVRFQPTATALTDIVREEVRQAAQPFVQTRPEAAPVLTYAQAGQHVDEAVDTEQQEQVEGTVVMPNREEESPPDPGAASTPPEHEDMDTHTGLANLQAGKRPRDQTNSLATTQDSSGGDEPPPKAPEDFKIVFKPGGGLDLRTTTNGALLQILCTLATIDYATARTADRVRINPYNSLTISTPSEPRARLYLRVSELRLGPTSYPLRAYMAAPANALRGMIYNAVDSQTQDEIVQDLHFMNVNTPCAIADAREMGRSKSILITFVGSTTHP